LKGSLIFRLVTTSSVTRWKRWLKNCKDAGASRSNRKAGSFGLAA
jgi:hypothetical protein